jgi:hypothetical protein
MTLISEVFGSRANRTGKLSYKPYRIKTFAAHGFGTFTGLATLALLMSDLIGLIDPDQLRLLQQWPIFSLLVGAPLLAAAIWGLHAQDRLVDLELKAGTQHTLRILVGDFIENLEKHPDASCAFGVNDQFTVTGLRAGSAHADFLEAYFGADDHAESQRLIDEALVGGPVGLQPATAASGAVLVAPERPCGPAVRESHPYGTVVCVPFSSDSRGNARHAFMLANSSQVAHGFRGQGTSPQLVAQIWEYHGRTGHVTDELLFTLIGNGGSRDVDPMTSARSLIDQYYRHLDEAKRTDVCIKKMIISISKRQVDAAEVDLEVLHTYAKARNALYRASL